MRHKVMGSAEKEGAGSHEHEESSKKLAGYTQVFRGKKMTNLEIPSQLGYLMHMVPQSCSTMFRRCSIKSGQAVAAILPKIQEEWSKKGTIWEEKSSVY